MRRLAALAFAVLALPLSATGALATTPGPSPSPSATPSATPTPVRSPAPSASPSPAAAASPSPDSAVLDKLKTRIGADLAAGLVTQQHLIDSLRANTAQEQRTDNAIRTTDAEIDSLTQEVARLDDSISETQARIDAERAEVAALARAIQRQPSPALAFARSKNLVDALSTATALLVAGDRAHRLQVRLEADLEKLSRERGQRQADLDRQQTLRDSLAAQLDSLTATIDRQQQVMDVLSGLLLQFRGAESELHSQTLDVTATLVGLLEEQQRSLNAASVAQAWSQAEIGASSVQVLGLGVAPADLALTNPNPTGFLTQPFGPTDLWFEPPLGPFPHFHTGVDLAAALGTPVLAAAAGVVTAAGSTEGGYGNFVVIEHGGQVQTLYGHLQASIVAPGQRIGAGEAIGYEGSTGFSTGPHLHFEVRVKGALVDPLPLITAAATPAPSSQASNS